MNVRATILLALVGCSKAAEPPLSEVGRFQVESGALLVIDPGCSVQETATLGAAVPSTRKGPWIASIRYVSSKKWGRRCAELHARRESLPTTERVAWLRQKELIGVDSGQAGLFDAKFFRRSELVPKDQPWKTVPIDPKDPWYSLCCEQTSGDPQAGVIPFGVVSSSGFGDGEYEWDVLRMGAEVVAVRIVFIPEEAR